MIKVKIINLMFFSPPHEDLISRFNSVEEYTLHNSSNVGRIDFLDINEPLKRVFFYLEDFGHIVLERIKQKTDRFELESWRPYLGLKKTYSKDVKGITFRAFPAIRKKSVTGTNYDHSIELVKELRRVIKHEKVILYFSYPSFYITKLLLILRPVNTPVFAIHRGWRLARFKKENMSKFDVFSRIKDKMEIICLSKYIDYYLNTIKLQTDYLKNGKKLNNLLNFFDAGVDFEFNSPAKNIFELRKELGIPVDKTILLYVGRFTNISGLDFLLDSFKELKEKMNDLILIMVGGNKNQDCYQKCFDAGAIMVERVDKNTLLKYYQISNIHVYPTRDYGVKNFGGIGTGIVESLACGVPVISDNLMHFEGSVEEREKVGRLLKSKNDFFYSVQYIIQNSHEFSDCRKIAKKYYNKERNTDLMIKYFDILSEKYYKEK